MLKNNYLFLFKDIYKEKISNFITWRDLKPKNCRFHTLKINAVGT